MSPVRLAALAAATLFALICAMPAQAVSMSQCSTLYKSAQTAGTLNGMNWNAFRKANCGSSSTASSTPAAQTAADSSTEPTTANTENAPEPSASKIVPPKGVIFPKAISAKYASEAPGKARMHTCLDQYKVDKTNNDLSGLTWIAKGGGYYSICNTRLKG